MPPLPVSRTLAAEPDVAGDIEENSGSIALIRAAVGTVENYLHTDLFIKTRLDTYRQLAQDFFLAGSPVQALLSVQYGDTEDVATDVYGTFTGTTLHNDNARVGRRGDFHITGGGTISLQGVLSYGSGFYFIRYKSGYTEAWDDLPAALQEGVLRVAANLSYAAGTREGDPEVIFDKAVTAILQPYKTFRLF